MFAKLYEIGDDNDEEQILVKIDKSDEDQPEVRFYFEPEGFGVCSTALSWEDTDEGWSCAEEYFHQLDKSVAKNIVNDMKSRISFFYSC